MSDREIIKALRKQIHIRTVADRGGTNLLILAADALEANATRLSELEQKLAEVERERDAAVDRVDTLEDVVYNYAERMD